MTTIHNNTPGEPVNGANGAVSGLGKSAARSRQIWDQCVGFEQVFVRTLLEQLQRSVDHEGGAMPESAAMRATRGMFFDRLADTLGEAGQTGIAKVLYRGFERAFGAVSLDDLQPAQTLIDEAA